MLTEGKEPVGELSVAPLPSLFTRTNEGHRCVCVCVWFPKMQMCNEVHLVHFDVNDHFQWEGHLWVWVKVTLRRVSHSLTSVFV